ncbi:MAG: ATP-binding protein, partial [Desulfonatronovibrionaceae bacterium]
MARFFNNAGPVKPEIHYTIDPLHRVDWEEISGYIDQQRYFVLHAPRQTGKTSTLLAMMKAINEKGRYACAYANIEGAQAARGDEARGIPAVCSVIAAAVRRDLGLPEVFDWLTRNGSNQPVNDILRQTLEYWSTLSDKPAVLFLDEVDALVGDTLISLLRQ